MKILFFLLSICCYLGAVNARACERIVTFDTAGTVTDYFKKDARNLLCVAWLTVKKNKLIESQKRFASYGIINGNVKIPYNTEYGIFTTFPLSTSQQVESFISENGTIVYEGIVPEPIKSHMLQSLLDKGTCKNYDTEKMAHELLTIHKVQGKKSKNLQLCLSIKNISGHESLYVTETQAN